jgi:hypothetical protein
MEKEVKLYRGRRWGPNARIEVTVEDIESGAAPIPLPHISRKKLAMYDWGYGGENVAELALAILADFFGEHPTSGAEAGLISARNYQELKWKLLASAPREEFTIRAYSNGRFVRDDDSSRNVHLTPTALERADLAGGRNGRGLR